MSAPPPNEPPPQYEPPKGQYPYPPPYPSSDYPPQQSYSSQPYSPQQPYSLQQPYSGMPNYQSTVVSQPQHIIVVNQVRPGPNPITIECPHCHQHIITNISHEAGALTWISVGVLVLFGCWLGCCLIPFCINDLQDVRHSCPNCHQFIGTYSRI